MFRLSIALLLISLISISNVSAYKLLCLTKGQTLPPNLNPPRFTCIHQTCQICVDDDLYPSDLSNCRSQAKCDPYKTGKNNSSTNINVNITQNKSTTTNHNSTTNSSIINNNSTNHSSHNSTTNSTITNTNATNQSSQNSSTTSSTSQQNTGGSSGGSSGGSGGGGGGGSSSGGIGGSMVKLSTNQTVKNNITTNTLVNNANNKNISSEDIKNINDSNKQSQSGNKITGDSIAINNTNRNYFVSGIIIVIIAIISIFLFFKYRKNK